MHRRRPTARHSDAIAVQRPARAAAAVTAERRDDQASDAPAPGGADDGVAGEDLDAPAAQHRQLRPAIGLPADIDQGHRDAGIGGIRSGLIGRRAAGGKDDPAARRDSIAVDEGAYALGEHDAGAIIVGENQRALMAACRQHHLLRADLPQALARQIGGRVFQVIGDALGEGDVVMVVVAEGGGAREERDVAARGEQGDRLSELAPRGSAADLRGLVVEERAAHLGLLIGEDDAPAGVGGGERRREARRPGSHHQHIAMGGDWRSGRHPARWARARDRLPRGCLARRAWPRSGAAT